MSSYLRGPTGLPYGMIAPLHCQLCVAYSIANYRLGLGVSFTMGAGNDTDFLNSDFPMYAAGGVALFIIYRAFVVSLFRVQHALLLHTAVLTAEQ